MKKRRTFPKKVLAVVIILGVCLTAGIVFKSLCASTSDKMDVVGCIVPKLPILKPNASNETKKITDHMIDAPFIDQRENYPTGCESVSTVMALRHIGIDIDVDEFIDDYLDCGQAPFYTNNNISGDSPNKYFLGSPYDKSGWGCYSPVIERALNKLINRESYSVKRLKGKSIKSMCENYINNGVPVILWATINMRKAYTTTTWETSSEESFTWIAPEHCLLLVGYDKNYYYFNDPLRGKQVKYKKAAVENAYDSLGKQAVVVQENQLKA